MRYAQLSTPRALATSHTFSDHIPSVRHGAHDRSSLAFNVTDGQMFPFLHQVLYDVTPSEQCVSPPNTRACSGIVHTDRSFRAKNAWRSKLNWAV